MIDTILAIPPFTVRLRSPIGSVATHLQTFYRDAVRPAFDHDFIDFDIEILPGRGARRWWRPQARFLLDGDQPFLPLPGEQAAPVFEWGLNWCVAQRPLGYAVIHAAVVAWGDRAVVMPGHPGAGKSTLCSSLVLLDGARLLSDELAIVDLDDSHLVPHPRPISLKNESIDIVASLPSSVLGPRYLDTRKGTLSHAAVPEPSRQAAAQVARTHWVVFPQFHRGGDTRVEEISRAEAFVLMSDQSFNKESIGQRGFEAVCRLLDGARCFEVTYGSTEGGLAAMRLLRGANL